MSPPSRPPNPSPGAPPSISSTRSPPHCPSSGPPSTATPYSSGVFYVWGHSYEFAARRDDLTRLLAPLAGHDDVWYCTNIALFDYEAARQRLVIATNRRTAYNPSILPVTVNVDGTLVTAGPGVTAL